MSKLVSLVMPAWRPHAAWLREAVEGALGQRDCQVEVLLIDDGSPHPVAELLGDFVDPRLRLIRKGHEGAAAARNAIEETLASSREPTPLYAAR